MACDAEQRGISTREEEHTELEKAIEHLQKDIEKLTNEKLTILNETQKRTK
jgi:prefoldin subunit 5